MSKYTAEQVESIAQGLEKYGLGGTTKEASSSITYTDAPTMLREYAALLRERESAKASVPELCVRNPAPHAAQAPNPTSPTIVAAPMLASARVPDGWQTIMQEKPAGATHYMVQPKWEHGQLMVGVRWFKPWKNGGYAEWCTDCDNEYPAFRVLNILDLSPTSITAAPKPETEE